MELANKIRWNFCEWIEPNQDQSRVEGEYMGKYYTAACEWQDGAPTEVQDIKPIPESELFNKDRFLTTTKK